MRKTSFILVLFLTSLGVAASAATPGIESSDPLVAVDRHRTSIIADIVRSAHGELARSAPGSVAEESARLTERLSKLRADRLLAASLTSTYASLSKVLQESDAGTTPTPARAQEKSLGDANRDLIYTPLSPCRLIDTRGFGAPIQGGAFAPGERRSYNPAGACSIPTSGVAAMLISFTTQNLTPNSGGYLSIIAPGAPITTSVDVFNFGASWSASNTSTNTGSAGQFDVYVNLASAQVVVDILGYFAPPSGNITLAESTSTAGNIMKGSVPFIHSFGTYNTFIGKNAGNFTMSGVDNTGGGLNALQSNSSGSLNTAHGASALAGNTSGSFNTAQGAAALQSNSIGNNNTASGAFALGSNANGNENVGNGVDALASNTAGSGNTACGSSALINNTTGNFNTACGLRALNDNATGSANIALGNYAGSSLTTGDYNIAIGNSGVAGEANTTRIGSLGLQTKVFVAGIRNVTTDANNAIAVVIDGNGQLGTLSSSRRTKSDIAEMSDASAALMKLRPVTFHYKADKDPAGQRLQYGLIAEEVAEVYPGLVAKSPDGAAETVLYQFLPPMLLNEVQKQQRIIESQAAELAAQRQMIAELQHQTADIAALRAELLGRLGR